MHRLILAATLSSSYGIYGPAYELAENAAARSPNGSGESEEYLNSEKYEIRQRNRNAPDSLVPLIAKLNRIRQSNRKNPIERIAAVFTRSITPLIDLLFKDDTIVALITRFLWW